LAQTIIQPGRHHATDPPDEDTGETLSCEDKEPDDLDTFGASPAKRSPQPPLRRRKTVVAAPLVAAVLAVAVFAAIVTWGSPSNMVSQDSRLAGLPVTPLGALEYGGILLGTDLVPGGPAAEGDDVVTVAIYTDFMSHSCGNFEKQFEKELSSLAQDGQIQLEYHIVALGDGSHNADRFSTRAAMAAAAVAKHDPANFLPFVMAMFDAQPTEGQDTRSDGQIATTAKNAGVSQAALDKLADPVFETWVTYTSELFMWGVQPAVPAIFMGLTSGNKRQEFMSYGWVGFELAVEKTRAGEPLVW